MTNPVDTDALRARADDDDALGYPEAAALQRAAADELDRLRAKVEHQRAVNNRNIDTMTGEIDRLRAVIENAPHEDICEVHLGYEDESGKPWCTCWKADAL